jgi:ribosomal protein L11 methyltransferase
MNYIELDITFKDLEPWREILVSHLAEKGFESFVETKTGLLSYIPELDFDKQMIEDLDTFSEIDQFAYKTIQDQNWNAEWEKNFDPVVVADKLAIIAPFHNGVFNQLLTITIQPQMSFGTGHHQTTWLMSKRLFELNLENQRVLDMGTGTGILAILAEKLAASEILAVDIDEWSYRNALENIELNGCHKIQVVLGDHLILKDKKFDLIIANINKNVLISHFETYSEILEKNGILLLSGFFKTDQEDLQQKAAEFGFIFESVETKDEWALLQFKLNN